MGQAVLILGHSGSGKSASMRNFEADEITLINVNGKQLPFRNQYTNVLSSDKYSEIQTYMQNARTKVIAVDDSQYLMTNEFMRRAKENGFQKFTDIANNFWGLIKSVEALPKDTVVYFLHHVEHSEDGREKAKTIGKLIDDKITLEGMFTIVIKAVCSDGKYAFSTQSNGSDCCKSPMGLFDTQYIDNDLKFVDSAIRSYYRLSDPVLCEECQAEILASKGKTANQIAEGTKRTYGVQLCWNCAAKKKAEKNET